MYRGVFSLVCFLIYGVKRESGGDGSQILLKKLIILMKNHKSINKNIKIVNLEILKGKTWFGDKDL